MDQASHLELIFFKIFLLHTFNCSYRLSLSILQINNASRIEETGFGFRMNIMDFTSDELAGKLEKLLTDKQLRKKWSDASLRVQKDNRILEVARRLCDYVEKL